MEKRKTAGELSLKAASDKTVYDPLEVGHALCDDIAQQLYLCAHTHESKFDEEEYFVVLNVATDPLIKGVRRHKYAAFLFMPSPRPNQSCFLYNKKTQKLRRMWSLPNPKVMAELSEMTYVDKKWKETKAWCDAFFGLKFWDYVRKQHKIKHFSELEYLQANREKLIESGSKECQPGISDPFDFSKVAINKIVDTNAAVVNE